MLVHDFLRTTASAHPYKTALIAGEKYYSFQQLDQDSDRIACTLQELGIMRGERVAIMMENSIPMIVSLFGIMKVGAVFTLLHPSTKSDKIHYMLKDCGVKCLFTQTNLKRFVNEG